MSIENLSVSRKWWWSKRFDYNKGVIIAGLIAFMLFYVLGSIIDPDGQFEVTILEIVEQIILYIAMMAMANVFYTLGWFTDILFNFNNSQLFRERLYAFGYWFSFALPILAILSIMVAILTSAL